MDTRRGTTPTITITADGITDLNDYDVIWITMKQGNIEITKEKGDLSINNNEATFTLSQEETLGFKAPGSVSIQLRALIGDEAVASDTRSFRIEEILRDGKIE